MKTAILVASLFAVIATTPANAALSSKERTQCVASYKAAGLVLMYKRTELDISEEAAREGLFQVASKYWLRAISVAGVDRIEQLSKAASSASDAIYKKVTTGNVAATQKMANTVLACDKQLDLQTLGI